MLEVSHRPVLLQEVIENLLTDTAGIYVDGTFGRGGHARALLARLSADARLVGFDKDPEAIAVGLQLAAEDARFSIVHGSFAEIGTRPELAGLQGTVSGVLLDLGVSSPQLDDASRGFSFMNDGPLDMRMNNDAGESAADWLNHEDAKQIEWVLRELGEERFAGRIARAIVAQREMSPLCTTKQLADLIYKAVPVREKHKHPATRSFQAVRIWVNRELQDLEVGLAASLELVKVGGRIAVISFHSLEDRIVKQFFEKHVKGEQLPRGLPVTGAALGIRLRHVAKKVRPSDDEVAVNVRSRSATLRVVEKIA
ncbi:Methyltransferase involved in cell envelope biogenesis [gamma proteobacterium HdN1]|nr:Methyltransferase involved in cell envelope biogenesis [gamma proteobacterium HdN1]